jgi:hypothetical protein
MAVTAIRIRGPCKTAQNPKTSVLQEAQDAPYKSGPSKAWLKIKNLEGTGPRYALSEGSIRNIVLNDAMILPYGANRSPDVIFGRDRLVITPRRLSRDLIRMASLNGHDIY